MGGGTGLEKPTVTPLAPRATDSAEGAKGKANAPSEIEGLESLLAPALSRLMDETGATAAAAWVVATGDLPVRVTVGDASAEAPGREALQTLLERRSALELGSPDLPTPLADYGRKCDFQMAVRLTGPDVDGAIFLRGVARPRSLAALAQAAERLQAPTATTVRVARLARLEDELARVTRLANLGDLLAETVHEIRNPLVSVKTFLQLLPENLDDPDFHSHFRGQVVEEVRRMERLLDGVLEQARPAALGDGEPARAPVGAVLASVARLLEKRAQERQLKLVVDLGPDLPDAAMDEDPLRQVLLNLTLNAFEVSPEGACVRLTARVGDDARLHVTVDDEGPGVPEDQRSRLFEAFFSTRAERPIGLGLSVCRSLVEAARGSIAVEAAPGEAGGARFRIALPCA